MVDLDIVRARHAALRRSLPATEIYYAVKANPAPEVIAALAQLGTHFDVASSGELDLCRGIDVAPARLAIGDTVDFLSAGAYTASLAAVAFNGYAPIRAYFV